MKYLATIALTQRYEKEVEADSEEQAKALAEKLWEEDTDAFEDTEDLDSHCESATPVK